MATASSRQLEQLVHRCDSRQSGIDAADRRRRAGLASHTAAHLGLRASREIPQQVRAPIPVPDDANANLGHGAKASGRKERTANGRGRRSRKEVESQCGVTAQVTSSSREVGRTRYDKRESQARVNGVVLREKLERYGIDTFSLWVAEELQPLLADSSGFRRPGITALWLSSAARLAPNVRSAARMPDSRSLRAVAHFVPGRNSPGDFRQRSARGRLRVATAAESSSVHAAQPASAPVASCFSTPTSDEPVTQAVTVHLVLSTQHRPRLRARQNAAHDLRRGSFSNRHKQTHNSNRSYTRASIFCGRSSLWRRPRIITPPPENAAAPGGVGLGRIVEVAGWLSLAAALRVGPPSGPATCGPRAPS